MVHGLFRNYVNMILSEPRNLRRGVYVGLFWLVWCDTQVLSLLYISVAFKLLMFSWSKNSHCKKCVVEDEIILKSYFKE